MFHKQTIKDISLENKTVLLRVDYNVPIVDGQVADDYRIKKSLVTIKYLLDHNCKIVICSHLGRPNGRVDPKFSLFPVAKRLKEVLDHHVEFVPECIGDQVLRAVSRLTQRQILLLENLRFHPEEKANDDGFAKQLASLGEVFVQDAFGVIHREQASIVGVPKYLPSVAGFLVEQEVNDITKAIQSPKRPLMTVIGGAKIVDKIDVLSRFIKIADVVAIGGAMANTFLAAEGLDVATSSYDKQDIHIARNILAEARKEEKRRNFAFILPFDGVVAEGLERNGKTRIVDWSAHVISDIESYPKRPPKESAHLQPKELILDVGPFSAALIAGVVQLAGTVIWNGTLGVTETESLIGGVGPFSHGTDILVQALTGEFGHKPYTVVGGGDTVGYIEGRKMVKMFDLVSTGGGASLELMAGHKLPGLEALRNI